MDHKELSVWKESVRMVTDIYGITKKFPIEEKFGLTNQIRRAAVSVPSNIAEGAARSSNKEFKQFLYIALGSLSELETQLIISNNLNYAKDISLENKLVDIRKMILGLIKYLSKN
jgi:four helix bundle protein